MPKIIDLIQSGNFDELKSILEDKVATKVAKKISEKKADFVEKMRLAKEKK